MGFNYAKEKRKFERQWADVRKQYEEAGMSQDAIEALYDFDWNWFKSRRRYISHLVDLPDGITVEDLPRKVCEAENTHLLKRYNMNAAQRGTRYHWMEEIENEKLLQKLMLLSDDELELLTALAFEGYTQSEIAQERTCSRMAICKQLHKIKKILT